VITMDDASVPSSTRRASGSTGFAHARLWRDAAVGFGLGLVVSVVALVTGLIVVSAGLASESGAQNEVALLGLRLFEASRDGSMVTAAPTGAANVVLVALPFLGAAVGVVVGTRRRAGG
jgi:hypothetical protein